MVSVEAGRKAETDVSEAGRMPQRLLLPVSVGLFRLGCRDCLFSFPCLRSSQKVARAQVGKQEEDRRGDPEFASRRGKRCRGSSREFGMVRRETEIANGSTRAHLLRFEIFEQVVQFSEFCDIVDRLTSPRTEIGTQSQKQCRSFVGTCFFLAAAENGADCGNDIR